MCESSESNDQITRNGVTMYSGTPMLAVSLASSPTSGVLPASRSSFFLVQNSTTLIHNVNSPVLSQSQHCFSCFSRMLPIALDSIDQTSFHPSSVRRFWSWKIKGDAVQ